MFRSRGNQAIKLLVHDGQGFRLCHKRLPQGRFRGSPLQGILKLPLFWRAPPVDMTEILSLPALAAVLAITGFSAFPAHAQVPGARNPMGSPAPLDPSVKRTYVSVGMGVFGALYEPAMPGEKRATAILVMHSDVNYTNHPAGSELARRGYTVLCAANAGGGLDRILLDAKQSVTYLRQLPGIRKVVLFGHSGGATLMTAYQLLAENGVKAGQGPEKISKCGDNLAGLPPSDGLVLADSNWGNAVMALFSLDPAVVENDNGMIVDPTLDLWNPKNGFDPGGSHYSVEFIRNFEHAVAKRENALIQTALERLKLIQEGKGRFSDDEPFVVAGAGSMGPNNKLFVQDTRLLSHTRKAWPLLHPDGTITNQIVPSVRVPEGGRSFTSTLGMGALNTTVQGFLKNNAIRVEDDFGIEEDSVHGLAWTSTYSCPPGNVEGIKAPLLVVGMTGHYEYLASETIYEHAKSPDKTLAFVEGASHMFTTCEPCEKTPGQFGNTQKTFYDFVDQWLNRPGRL